MNLELNVVRFNNEDVIATSGCTLDSYVIEFDSSGTGVSIDPNKLDKPANNPPAYNAVNRVSVGSIQVDNGDELPIYYGDNNNLYVKAPGNRGNGTDYTGAKTNGVYHFVGGKFIRCEDGHNLN